MHKLCILLITFISSAAMLNAQWQLRNYGLGTSTSICYSFDAFDSNNAVLASDALFKTTNSGITWSKLTVTGQLGVITDVSCPSANNIWVVTGEACQILHSSDGGTSWSEKWKDPSKTSFLNYIKMFDSQNGIAMGDAPTNPVGYALFLVTHDGGNNWTPYNNALQAAGSGDLWRRLSFFNTDTGYFYASFTTQPGLYFTLNSGTTWQLKNINEGGATVLQFYNPQIGILQKYEGTSSMFIRTVNGGATWETVAPQITGYCSDIAFMPNDPAKVWISMDRGLFFSHDTGRTWLKDSISTYLTSVRKLVYTDARHGWMACDNGKVFYTATAHSPSLIPNAVDQNQSTADNYLVADCYPNPFNASTRLEYWMANSGHIKIELYAVTGAKVSDVLDAMQTKGKHTITYTTADLPSGIYICRFITSGQTVSKKLVLLK